MLKNLAMVLGLVVGLSACADPYYGYHGSGSNGYGYQARSVPDSRERQEPATLPARSCVGESDP